MEVKQISFGGIVRTPSDFLAKDGEMAECVNMIIEDGEATPVSPPILVNGNTRADKLLFVHHTSVGANYITYEGNTLKAFRVEGEDDIYFAVSVNIPNISKVYASGNVLIVLAENGIHYLLFKNNDYTYLGQRPPEVSISFGLDGGFVNDERETFDFGKVPVHSSSDLTSIWTDDAKVPVKDYEVYRDSYQPHILGKVNKFIADKATNDGKFMFPFFVRYAYRMWDGSLIMHSAPILMMPADDINPYAQICGATTESNQAWNFSVRVGGFVCSLNYCIENIIVPQVSTSLADWEDLIKSIDIFISAPIYTYDQSEDILGITKLLFNDDDSHAMRKYAQTAYGLFKSNDEGKLNDPSVYEARTYGSLYTIHSNNFVFILPRVSDDDFKERLESCGNFYLVSSIEYKDIVVSGERKNVTIKEGLLAVLQQQEEMTDDYNSHNIRKPQSSFEYNSRLNIANIHQTLFEGFPINAMTQYQELSPNALFPELTQAYDVDVYTALDFNGATVNAVQSTQVHTNKDYFPYLFYPNALAKTMYLKRSNKSYKDEDGTIVMVASSVAKVDLKEHPTLNGAFAYIGIRPDNILLDSSPNSIWKTFGSLPEVNPEIKETNKLMTSEAGNPFVFPLNGVNTVGTGEIKGVASTAKALSQGQFGDFPLYLFATDGIWAMTVSTTGIYATKQVVSRDVCNNSDSITQIDNAIIFTSDAGLMFLSGSEIECLSSQMLGAHFNINDLPNIIHSKASSDIQSLISASADTASFIDYLMSSSIAYDYSNSRLIILNPDKKYQYVYSLKSGMYSKLYDNNIGSLTRVVNDYPNCYMQGEDGKIYNYSVNTDVNDYKDTIPAFMVTRPLSFDAIGYKTINKILNKGVFRKGAVKIALYGSNDCLEWYRIPSLGGQSWKYYRIAYYTNMLPTERLTATLADITPRFSNKIR